MQSVVSLDTQETTGKLALPRTYRALSDHSTQEELSQVRVVYSILDGAIESPRVKRLDECRTQAWFVRHSETGQVRVASQKCHIRWCPFCAGARQGFLTGQVASWLDPVEHPKLLTVTLKHSTAPIAWQIKNLYQYFMKFRKRSYLKNRITGGVWFFQIKKSKNDHLWHPHIHALISGDYLEHDKLKKLWQDITFSSSIVDIRSVKDKDNAIRHVARYAASPGALADLDLDDACSLVSAMKGLRIVGTWGTARKISLRPEKPDDADKWLSIGKWSTVHYLQETDDNAKAIIKSFYSGEPLDEQYSMRPVEKQIADELEIDIHAPPKQIDQTFFD